MAGAKVCGICGEDMPVASNKGAPRQFCMRCRPPRPTVRTETSGIQSKVVLAEPVFEVTGDLVRSTTRELENMDQLGTAVGDLLLNIATRIDSNREPGASLAALAKQFRDTYDRARFNARADEEQEEADDLAGRRERVAS